MGSGEDGWWGSRSPGGCQWSGCGRGRHGVGVHEGQQSGEGGRWRKKMRSGGGDDGNGGGGGGDGNGGGVGEAGQRRGVQWWSDWQTGGDLRHGSPQVDVPSLVEVVERRT